MTQRLAAFSALGLGAVALGLAVTTAVREFPGGLVVPGCVVFCLGCGWYGLVRRGIARAAGFGAAALSPQPWPCSSLGTSR